MIHKAMWGVNGENYGIRGEDGRFVIYGIGRSRGFNPEQTSSVKNPDDDDLSPTEILAEDEHETAGTAQVIENTIPIIHKGFASDDLRQQYVQYAYSLGGMDFVTLLECENGNWSIWTKGDYGHAWGLCQLNDRWHDITDEYKNQWKVQIETCYEKYKGGTPFYGPSRKVKGQRCSTYVLDRFIINE